MKAATVFCFAGSAVLMTGAAVAQGIAQHWGAFMACSAIAAYALTLAIYRAKGEW